MLRCEGATRVEGENEGGGSGSFPLLPLVAVASVLPLFGAIWHAQQAKKNAGTTRGGPGGKGNDIEGANDPVGNSNRVVMEIQPSSPTNPATQNFFCQKTVKQRIEDLESIRGMLSEQEYASKKAEIMATV